MKKIISLILALTLVLGTALVLASCGEDSDADAAFVSLDINPSIELTVEDGKVVGAYGANEDGMVLLYSEDGIVGEKVEDAVAKITALAVEYGYVSEENAVVNTSVISESKSYAEALGNELKSQIEKSAQSLGVNVSASGELNYSTARRLEQLKEKYPDNEKIQALTPAEFRLAYAVSESGEVTLDAAVEMDTAKLVELVNEHHAAQTAFATAAFKEARHAADEIYEQALGTLTDAVYIEYYVSNILKYPTSIGNALLYQIYNSSERALNLVADGVSLASRAADYPLGEESVAAALEVFGLTNDDRALIEDLSGNVTLRSIEAYANKLFKNSEASAEYEQLMAELDVVLDGIDAEVSAKKAELIEEFADEIEAIEEQVSDTVEGIAQLIPEGIKATVQNAITTVDEVLDVLARSAEDGKLTASEIRESAERFAQKASELEDAMNAEIGESGAQAIEEKKNRITENMSAAKAAFDSALDSAEEAARAFLENAKAERIAALT